MSRLEAKFFLNRRITLQQARQVHVHILINGLDILEPLLVRQILQPPRGYSRGISNYVKTILYSSRSPDSFSWSSMIRFLSQHDQFKEAFVLYAEMLRHGVLPSSHAISSSLRSCARIEYKNGGISVHAQVLKLGQNDCVYVQTSLVDFYSKVGDFDLAKRVFDGISDKNVVSWNSIVSGYLKSGNLVEARKVFEEMPEKGVVSWNSIISGYAKAGDINQACSLFQLMPEKDSTSWNSIVSGYIACGEIGSARRFFDAMPQKSSISWIMMISGYAKCGDVRSARELFDQIHEKDTVIYNSIIACYAQNSQPNDALKLFNDMLKADKFVRPDKITLSSVLSACSQLGDVRFGSWVESYIAKLGIEMDDHMATTLIDLYMKCGNTSKAFDLFHNLRKRDLVSYSAMILGCGINGQVDDAANFFDEMLQEQIRPNTVTFTGLLTAYSHSGLVEEGYKCLTSMNGYGVEPSVDHYGIVVDLLGRAGKLQEAYELIKNMPMQPNAGVWGALLLASGLHNNVEIGEIAAERCSELESDPSGYLSHLSNIYMSVGRLEDAMKLRNAIQEKKLLKTPGCSWLESNAGI